MSAKRFREDLSIIATDNTAKRKLQLFILFCVWRTVFRNLARSKIAIVILILLLLGWVSVQC